VSPIAITALQVAFASAIATAIAAVAGPVAAVRIAKRNRDHERRLAQDARNNASRSEANRLVLTDALREARAMEYFLAVLVGEEKRDPSVPRDLDRSWSVIFERGRRLACSAVRTSAGRTTTATHPLQWRSGGLSRPPGTESSTRTERRRRRPSSPIFGRRRASRRRGDRNSLEPPGMTFRERCSRSGDGARPAHVPQTG
jgi:hypothetical protein